MFKLCWTILIITVFSLVGCGGGGGGGGSTSTVLRLKLVDAITDTAISGASVTLTPTAGAVVNGVTDTSGQYNASDYTPGESAISITDPKNIYQPFQTQIDMPEGLSSYSVTLRLIPTSSPIPDTITLAPKNPTFNIGDKQQFTATITPNSGLKPSWTIFGSIGTLTSNGLFTATTLGTGTVTVQIGSLYASTLVTVKESGVTPKTGNVSGTIIDGSSPLYGANISLGSSSTTSDSNGNYSFTNVSPGVHAISASKTGYGNASGNVTCVAGITSTLNIAIMPDANTVRLGKDRTITNFNYHDWGVGNISALLRAPNGGSAQSGDDTASVSESGGPGFAQEASARLGVDITWDLNGKTWAQASSTPCSVTIIFDYSIQANYTDNEGYANSGIKVETFDSASQWYDRIGDKTADKGTHTKAAASKTYQTTLSAIGNRISMLAQCNVQTKSTAPAEAISTSQAQLTIKSISINF